ncbi:DNA-deoxyinosine glycosylase [Methylosoma difficile]
MNGMQANKQGFPPIVSANVNVVILGTMPGERSLQQQQYYAHRRNAFWPIMASLLGFDEGAGYEERRSALLQGGVAVWDVLHRCCREGSLDSNIAVNTIQPNDFVDFFAKYPAIKHVYFNGGVAEKLFKKYVLPNLEATSSLLYLRLPSTSPAYAAMSLLEKQHVWRAALPIMVK